MIILLLKISEELISIIRELNKSEEERNQSSKEIQENEGLLVQLCNAFYTLCDGYFNSLNVWKQDTRGYISVIYSLIQVPSVQCNKKEFELLDQNINIFAKKKIRFPKFQCRICFSTILLLYLKEIERKIKKFWK